MNVFRIIRRNISLHAINAVGPSIVTASLLLSAGYLHRELNYDRHNTESERTARLSIGFQDEPVDGRIWGEIPVMLLKEIPEIEETASDVFAVDSGFFRIFDVRMLESADGIPGSEQIMVSESFASKLKGESGRDVLMSPVRTDSRKLRTDTFITGIFEDSVPLLIMQRNLFQSCIMIRMVPGRAEDGLEIFNKVWAGVNPQREPDYTLMSDIFNGQYRNEMNARRLTGLFSILCLVLADLGLIIFMAFIIKRRTREIAIRKVQGASVPGIVRMLNLDLIRYIAVAFIVSIPVSWLVLHRWLEHFSYKIHIWWWLFIAAGAIVAVIALASVSVQSWRAATANPVKGIGTE